MNIKLLIFVFVVAIVFFNVYLFFFVRGVDLIDQIKSRVGGVVRTYFPVADPLYVTMIFGSTGVVVVGFILLKMFGKQR